MQQTLTQTITIDVPPTPGVPDTGVVPLAGNSVLYLVVLTSIFLVLVTLFLFRLRLKHIRKLAKPGTILGALVLLATGVFISISTSYATPALTLDSKDTNIAITIPKGGGNASKDTTLTATTDNSSGYTLSAVLESSEPGITLDIKGGALTTSTALLAGTTEHPVAPLTLASTSTANSSSDPTTDNIPVTLTFHIDGTVTAGKKSLKLAYKLIDNPSPDIQTITADNCPSTRTRVKDARDNHTYYIQALADGNCWMETNLAYAGGGTDTYGDVQTGMTLNNGTSGDSYTSPIYSTPTGANPTTGSTNPSTSTDGGATNPQYGYLYNWCAAMTPAAGGGACSSSSSTQPNAAISICPAGWRLPTSAEFTTLNNDINSGSTSSSSGLLSTWLAQYSGGWGSGFYDQGSGGYYWSSTVYSAYIAYSLYFNSSYVDPANYDYQSNGLAVRCVAESSTPIGGGAEAGL